VTGPRQTWQMRPATLLRIVLPLLLLGLILSQLDFSELWIRLKGMNPIMYVLGVLVSPLYVAAGALRWHCILAAAVHRRASYWFLLKHYVISLSVGQFTPATIGTDVYRVILAGKRYGSYDLQIIAIILEKFVALAAAILAVFALHPFIDDYIAADITLVEDLHEFLTLVLAVCAVAALGAFFLQSRDRLKPLLRKGVASYNLLAKNIAGRLSTSASLAVDETRFASVLKNTLTLRTLALAFALSLIGLAAVALRGQILLIGMGYDFPILANLYVVPIMTFLFMLPVSFAGLGIREATYIVLYGMFGIPMESALALSLFSLSAALIVNAIGAAAAGASPAFDRA